MVLASFLFATMGVGVKIASESFTTTELVFYRGIVSMIFMGVVMRANGISVRTPVVAMQAWRSLTGVLSLGAWFYAIAHLPLATAMTLNYMSGVWIAAFIVGGAILYGKPERQGPLLATVLAGFIGVVLTLRPTIDSLAIITASQVEPPSLVNNTAWLAASPRAGSCWEGTILPGCIVSLLAYPSQ